MFTRNENGTFAEGNAGGPGRPKAISTDYQAIFREVLKADDAREIIFAAVEQAKKGDRYARDWVFAHVVSRMPTRSTVEPMDADMRAIIPDMLSQFREKWAAEDPKDDPYYVEPGSEDDYAE